jgi:hypothetical protein
MNVALSTGGVQDYLELKAESLTEAANLLECYQGVYAKEHQESFLLMAEYAGLKERTIKLRIHLGTGRPGMGVLDPVTREEMDQTA